MTTVEELRSGGRLVSTGTFDLDPARAREKLARYQLTDPHRYVLQFVQAAQLLGATKITAAIDADEVEMTFDGESPTAGELGEIYLHAFGQRGIARLEALRHLALGVIAAEAVAPAVVRVAGRHATLTVKDAREAVSSEEVSPHNEIYVRERARLGHLVEFFRTIRGRTAEEVALRDARYATPKLVVNGEVLNVGNETPRGAIRIDGPQESGWLSVGRGAAELTLVQHGVALERVALQIGTASVEGVVETSRLSTNLSQSAFVRNHMWDALFETVIMPAALRATDDFLSRQLRVGNRLMVEAMVAAALRGRIQLSRRSESFDTMDEIVMRWADVAIWRRLETKSAAAQHVSTQQLLASIGEGPVFVSAVDEPLDVLRHRGAIVEHVLLVPRARDALSPLLLAEATGRGVVDLTDEIRELTRSRLDRVDLGDREGLRWRDDLLGLDPHQFAHVERVIADGLRVEIGVPDARIRQALPAVVVVEGTVKLRTELDCRELAGCTLLVAHDPATDEAPSELVRAAAPLVVRAAVDLLRAPSAQMFPPALRLEVLYSLATSSLVERLFRVLGWGDGVDLPLLDELPTDGLAVAMDLLQGEGGDVPMFEEVGSRRWVSMRSLAEADPVRFVPARSRRRALQVAWEVAQVGVQPPVWLDARERTVLEWMLGEGTLEDVEAELHAAAARIQRDRTGLEEEPVLHGLYVRKRTLEGARLRGEVGMSEPGGSSSFIELVVLYQGKRLAHRELPCSDGQFRAVVESSSLRPTADMSDVREDDAFATLAERIRAVCLEMFEAWCVQQLAAEAVDDVDRLTLWRAVAAASPEQHSHRLDWPVFATSEGDMSARMLRERAVGSPVVVSARPVDGADFVVFLPLAATEHLAALARVLPDTQLSRARRPVATAAELPTNDGDVGPVTVEHDDVLGHLQDAGFAVDAVQVVDDSVLAPRLRDRQLSIGARHALANHLAAPTATIVAAIGIAIADGPEQLATVLRRLTDAAVG